LPQTGVPLFPTRLFFERSRLTKAFDMPTEFSGFAPDCFIAEGQKSDERHAVA
jgi:hypothetical protein